MSSNWNGPALPWLHLHEIPFIKNPKRAPAYADSRNEAAFLTILLVLIAVAGVCIISTYWVFSATADEPATVSAGMEWLDRGTYELDDSHPPLARVAAALGLYLDGVRMPAGEFKDLTPTEAGDWTEVGKRILYSRHQYLHNLSLARLGILPFFFMAVVLIWVWARKTFDETSAVLAVALFTTLPPVLGNAGLATTDMVLTATFIAAMLNLMYWLERPTYFRSGLLGLTIALAILSKFSALLFLPLCGLTMLACKWILTRHEGRGIRGSNRRRVVRVCICAMTAFLVIWAGYRFSVHTMHRADRPHEGVDRILGSEGILHNAGYVVLEHIPIPAPALIKGINFQRLHNDNGSASYLFGKARQGGWWYFYPVILAVKTPLAFLLLFLTGVVFIATKRHPHADWRAVAPAAMAVALLIGAMFGRIDLGVRLILPIYPLLAIVGGYGAAQLWTNAKPRSSLVGPTIVTCLLIWQFTTSVVAHPDYLAYFNELAGSHPERISVGPDLDWGQDLLRLTNVLEERKIDAISIKCVGLPEFDLNNVPQAKTLVPFQPTTGWVAVSMTRLERGDTTPPYYGYSWLKPYQPVARVGDSILLYCIEPGTADDRAGSVCSTAKKLEMISVRGSTANLRQYLPAKNMTAK